MRKSVGYVGLLTLMLMSGVFASQSATADANNFYLNYQMSSPNGNSFRSHEMSFDGQTQAITLTDVYVSRNFGANWSKTLSLNYSDAYVGVSENGQYMVASGIESVNQVTQARTGGYLYVSSDYGSTWIERTSAGRYRWKQLMISNDGSKIFGITESQYDYSSIGSSYYSSDSGISFAESKIFPNGAGDRAWSDFDMSADGSKIFMVGTESPLWVNLASGAPGSWSSQATTTARGSYAVNANSSGSKVWYSSDADGLRVNTNANNFTSWTYLNSGPFYDFEVSSNGKYILAASQYRFYASYNSGANWTLADFSSSFAGYNLSWQGFQLSVSGDGQYAGADIGYGNLYQSRLGADQVGTPSATPGNSQIQLSWSAPNVNSATISDYEIQQSTDNGATWSAGISHTASTSTTRTITGLTNGNSYQYRVAAVTEWGSGPYSEPVSTTPYTLPGAPTSVTGVRGNGSVALTWSAPASNGGTSITDYLIEFSSGGGYSTFSDGTSTGTDATVTGLTNGTAYTFRVSAINAAGTGTTSSVSSSVTPLTTPSAPQNLVATKSNQSVVLTWSAPSSTGGTLITDYTVEYSLTGTSGWNSLGGVSTLRTETITSLTNGTLYYFRVSAVNSIGTSAPTSNLNATPSTVANAPTSLIASPGNGQVSLTFTAGNDGGSALTDYIIEYSVNGGGSWSTYSHTATTASPILVTGLTNYTTYVFKLTPLNGNGSGSTSSASAAVTPGGTLTSISLTRQSVGSAAGALFGTQPQITLRDQYSGTLLSDSSTVITASVSAGAQLVGTLTATSISGVSTFTNLGISGVAGTSYTISFSTPGVSSVTQSITVTVGQATRLKVSRNSIGGQTGVIFPTQPEISVVDSGGNLVSSYSSAVVSAATDNNPCFRGAGGETATAINGVATFSGLALFSGSGNQCLITYSATSLASAFETITVTSGPAAYITRTIRPDLGYYGRAIGQQPVYTITDSAGNIVTTDNSTTLTISASSYPNLVVSNESATAVNGVVSFVNLGFSGVNAGTFMLFNVRADSFSNTYTDSIAIIKGDPVLTWSNSTKIAGSSSYSVVAPTSNTAGSFSYSSSTSSVASISGATITIVGQGSTLLTATFTPTDTTNFNSGVTVSSTLMVTASSATISISIAGGVVTVPKGIAVTITASLSVAGKVKFYANGKVISGCAAKSATTSATCSWKPSIQGQSVLLTALLDPTSSSYSNVKSAALNIGVTRRTGRR